MIAQRGYTLIEILIVLLIISIVSAVAMLTISYNQNKQIENLANQIANLLSLATEEAMLRPATIGLSFSNHSFNFYLRAEDKQHHPVWKPIGKPPLNLHQYSNKIQILVKIGDQILPENGQPQITIAPGGTAPFTILFRDKNDKPRFKVTETIDGTIKSERVNEE